MGKKWVDIGDGHRTVDLTGQKFGRLTFECFIERRDIQPYWKLQCDCGNPKIAAAGNVKSGNIKSCGCLQKENGHNSKTNMEGVDIGWWEIDFSVDPKPIGNNTHLHYLVRCTRCNNTEAKWVNGIALRKGESKSCGCFQKEISSQLGHNTKKDMEGFDTGWWEIDFSIEPRAITPAGDLRYWAHCTHCGIITKWVSGSRIRTGATKSCGCVQEKYRIQYKNAPHFNPAACDIINEYGLQNDYDFRHAMNGGEFRVLKYYVDGYDPNQNVVIEVDELRHYVNGKLKKTDIERQKRIMRHLACTFIRIRIDKNNHILRIDVYHPDVILNHGIISI